MKQRKDKEKGKQEPINGIDSNIVRIGIKLGGIIFLSVGVVNWVNNGISSFSIFSLGLGIILVTLDFINSMEYDAGKVKF